MSDIIEYPEVYERLRAERVMLTIADVFTDAKMHGLRSSARVDVDYDIVLRRMAVQMVAYIAGVPKEHLRIYHRWPRTWWDAFKERWFPAWLARWHPVEYEIIDIDRTVAWTVCPHLELPKEGEHLVWLLDKSREPVKEIYPPEDIETAGRAMESVVAEMREIVAKEEYQLMPEERDA